MKSRVATCWYPTSAPARTPERLRLGGAWRFLGLSALLLGTGAAQVIPWNGGDILTVLNPATVDAGETLVIDTTGLHDFNAKAVTNDGTVSWLAGPLRSGNSGSFTNNAAFDDSATNEMNSAYGGTWAFNNTATGVYTKSAGTTTVQINVAFNNQGLINATGGTLTLSGGGNLGGGTIQAALGATVNLASGFSGTGPITFSGAGDIRFTGSLAAGSTLEGPLNWVSGNFNGAGTTTFGTTATITLTGSAGTLHDFNQRAVVNNGTVNWTAGQFRAGNSASFTNNADFNDTATNQANSAYGGTWAFNNTAAGTYTKSAGDSVFVSGVAFNNAGLVHVTNGTLTLQGGGNLAGGTINAEAGTTVDLASSFAAPGTVTFSGAGDIRLTGSLGIGSTIEGPLNWVSGNFNGAGTTTFGPTAVITLTGASGTLHDFNQRALVNNGTVNWTIGELRAGNSASFTNNSAFNDSAANQSANSAYGGIWAFHNTAAGTYTKSSGGTLFASGVAFNNAGLVHVSSGSLTLQGGGNLAGGTIQADTGATVDLASGFNSPGVVTFAGAGDIRFTSGTMSGATTFEGPLNWVSGNFNGGGATTFGSTAVVKLTGSVDTLHDFNQRALVNQGTFHWIAGQFRAGNSASFTNHAAFHDTATNQVNSAYGGTWAFHNTASGTYTKSAGDSTFASGVAFHNAGLVEVTGGTLTLQGGGNLAGGTLQAAAGTTVTLASGFNSPGVVTFAGAGDIRFTSGTMSGATTFEGPLNWVSGNFNGGGTTTFGSTAQVAITTTNLHDFNQRALVNYGSVTWNDGPIRAGNSASFTNHGVFTDAGSGDQFNSAFGGTWSLVNAADGRYEKIGTGTTTVVSGVGFTNAGTLALEHGTLAVQGGLTLAATSELLWVLSGPATDTGYGLLSVSTTLALNGTLDLKFGSGFDTATNFAATHTLLTASSLSGAFTNVANGGRLVSSDGLGSYAVHYGAGSPFGANNLVITGFISVPEPSSWAMLGLGLAAVALTFRQRRR